MEADWLWGPLKGNSSGKEDHGKCVHILIWILISILSTSCADTEDATSQMVLDTSIFELTFHLMYVQVHSPVGSSTQISWESVWLRFYWCSIWHCCYGNHPQINMNNEKKTFVKCDWWWWWWWWIRSGDWPELRLRCCRLKNTQSQFITVKHKHVNTHSHMTQSRDPLVLTRMMRDAASSSSTTDLYWIKSGLCESRSRHRLCDLRPYILRPMFWFQSETMQGCKEISVLHRFSKTLVWFLTNERILSVAHFVLCLNPTPLDGSTVWDFYWNWIHAYVLHTITICDIR